MIAYFDGRFVDRDKVAISPDDRGFLFADGVYEVIRAYGGRPFAVAAHEQRLRRSLAAIRLDWPAVDGLPDLVEQLLAENRLGGADALVYFQATRGAAPRRHRFPDAGTPPTIYAAARAWRPPDGREDGVAAILVPDTRWSRCDIKSIALLPNVLAHQQAVDAGAEEAIFVRDGALTEGTRTNVCAVLGGEVLTHPLDNRVLAGVTRAEVAAACAEIGLPWRDEPVLVADVDRLDELILLGTTMEVTPVVALDGRPVGSGRPGPMARRLLAVLRARTAG